MQKKVLLPLMLTVPAAMPALANIPLGFPKDGDWVKTDITSGDWIIGDDNITCPVGTGNATATFKNLPKGKYFVRFVKANNVEMKVNGESVAVGDEDGNIPATMGGKSGSFSFDGEGDLELKFSGKNKSIGFSFEIKSIVLEVSEEAYTDVQNAYNKLNPLDLTQLNQLAEDDDFQEAVDLRAQLTDFINNATKFNGVSMTDVLANLQTMAAENDIESMEDAQKWIDLYKEYGLDKTPSSVLASQNKWIEWVKEYNEEVVAENAIWQRYLDNVATRTNLLNEQAALMENAEALNAAIVNFKVVDDNLKTEYVNRINAYITELNEYKASIESAYADPAGPDRRELRKVITFESQKPALEGEYNTLATDFDTFKKDYNAYYDINFVQLTNLKNAYDAYVKFLKDVKGVEGYEDVYNDLVIGEGEGVSFENPAGTSKLGTANTTYENTKNKNQIEAVEGASADYQAKLDAINTVIEGWKNLTTEFTELVTTQNDNMTAAQGVIDEWSEKVAEYGKLAVPEHMKDQFNANLKAITDAIEAYKTYVDTEYKAHTLDLENLDYEAKVDAVNEAISAMDQFVAPMQIINDLLKKLEAAKKEVDKLAGGEVDGDDEGETTNVSIAGRFNSTYEGLRDAIKALTLDEAQDKDITGKIETQIKKYQADAETYAANLEKANKAISGFQKAYTGLTGFLDNKIFDTYKDEANTYLERVKNKYRASWKRMFDTPIKGFRNDLYQAVIKGNDQESFEALAAVVAALEAAQADELSTETFDAQKVEFAKNGTFANWDFGTDRVNSFGAKLDTAIENDVTHASELQSNFEEVKKELEDLKANDITEAQIAEDKPAAYGKCDVKIKATLDKLQVLIDKLDNYQKTQDNYNDLKANWDALLPVLDGLIKYNNDYSLEPAKSFFADEKIGTVSEESKEGTLGKRIYDLDAELDKALSDTKIVTDAEKEALQKKIDDIKAAITATRDAIELNNNTHNSQLDKEREERTHALDVIAQIDAKGAADGSADLEIMKQWKEDLQSIIDNDIVNENIIVTNAYGAGESAAQDGEIMAAYNTIHEKIQAIEDQLKGDAYTQAVKDANALTTQSWAVSYYDKLMQEWRKAIQDFNHYYYDLENQGWKNFIHEAIRRHLDEFASHKDIDNLNAEVIAYIAEQNAKPHVITPEEWAVWTGKADDLSKVINDRVVDLEEEADNMAKAYYQQLHGQAQNAVNDAEAALEGAGIDPTTYLAEANGYLTSAEGRYAAATNGDETLRKDNVGREMDGIAAELDKVIPAIDVQAACQTAWDAEYEDVLSQIEELRERIEKAEFCPDDVKAARMLDFEEKYGTILALNTEVKSVTENLVASYAGYVETLNTLLEGMENDVAEIEKASEMNKENQDIYNDFNNVWAPALEEQYRALENFCNALGGSGDMQGTLDNIKGAIDALKDNVEAQKANLLDKEIKEQCENIEASIANAYQTAGDTEISWLRKMLEKTKIAFNDAMVKGESGTTLDQRLQAVGSDKTQAGIEAEIHEISWAVDPREGDDAPKPNEPGYVEPLKYNPEDKEGFKTTAQGYEDTLCELYDVLQSTWNEQAPSVGIKAGLDALYNEIDGLITSGQSALGECLESVQTEFVGQYEALKEKLDAQKAGWDADGSDVIAHEAGYKRTLGEIKGDVNDLTAQIAAAQQAALDKAEKERVNNEKYAELKAQYDELQGEFDAAKALVESYENGISESYEYMAENIQNWLDNALADLNSKNEKVALTADSELLNAGIIASSINTYKTNATRAYAGVQFSTINDKDYELSEILKGHIVPAIFNEIKEALTPLRGDVAEIRGEYWNADFDRLNEIIEEAKRYITTYDQLIGKAQANSFIPGDVNLDGSVDVFDVQTLINMIGEGVTYDELYAENPLEACAADVLDDDQINVADVTSIIYIIQGEDSGNNRVRAMKPAADAAASASLMLVSEENGVCRYAMMLNNNTPFIAGQFDITVSGNSRVVGITAADRAAEHDVYAFETENGGARVILANMENMEITGSDGVLVFIDVEGDNKVSTVNAQFADKNNRLHKVGDSHTSAVDTILDNIKDGAERIWDAAGRRMRSFQRGINIIRHKDGRVTKEIRK